MGVFTKGGLLGSGANTKSFFYENASALLFEISVESVDPRSISRDHNKIINTYNSLFKFLYKRQEPSPIFVVGFLADSKSKYMFVAGFSEYIPAIKDFIVTQLQVPDVQVIPYKNIIQPFILMEHGKLVETSNTISTSASNTTALNGVSQTGNTSNTASTSNTPAYVNTLEFGLKENFLLPIKNTMSDVDPLLPLISLFKRLKNNDMVLYQVFISPFPDLWHEYGREAIKSLFKQGVIPDFSKYAKPHKFLKSIGDFLFSGSSTDATKEHYYSKEDPFIREITDMINNKINYLGFNSTIQVIIATNNKQNLDHIKHYLIGSLKQFDNPPFNGLTVTRDEPGVQIKVFPGIQILNTYELAYLFHTPFTTGNASIFTNKSKFLPAPEFLKHIKGIPMGLAKSGGELFPFCITQQDKLRHLYILGKSGTGKSTLLKNLILGEIMLGTGVAVIDPHGDLVQDLLDYIPESRINDVVYFNPADTAYPIGFNPVYIKEDEKQNVDVIADGILSVFKRQFKNSWGPRLEYILYNAIVAVLLAPGTTLLSIQKLLIDKNYRKRILGHIKDPGVLFFWRQEYARMAEDRKFLTQVISSIQNKVGRLITPKTIRNILGQTKTTFNLRDIIANNKILLVNLSKGLIGEENSSLLGSLLITYIYSTVLQQGNVSENMRNYFSLYIDEVQSFTTDTFVNILSEARKYRLSLTIAHQFIEQLEPEIVNAIFGNVANSAIFNVGIRDAKRLEEEFAPYVTAQDFINLDRFNMYVRLLVDGKQTPVFWAKTFPVAYKPQGLAQNIIELSRQKYATPVQVIEEKLNKWLSG